MAIKNLNKVLKNLEKFGDEAKESIHVITGDIATNIALDAKMVAPIDLGKLRQGIKAIELGKSDFKIMANSSGLAPYSAYIEFGTGMLVNVPEELREIAIRFKGKGVKQINIQPQPYLYPSWVKGKKQYVKDLKDELKRLTKKYE